MKISQAAKNAFRLGALCTISYLAVYVVRNMLGAVTPQLLEAGIYTEAEVGALSSLYFICYAIGQLINGIIGDRIKARYMMSFGLFLGGLTSLLFSFFTATPALALTVYGASGFFLAMIYGPMTKVVAENTEPLHATRCSLGYTVATLVGSPIAGLLAAFLAWQNVFTLGSSVLMVIAVACFFYFIVLEKRGIVRYGQYKRQSTKLSDAVRVLLKRRILTFTVIAIVTGIVRNSVVFWLPTYISQALHFNPQESASIYTVATMVIATSSFISVFLYERLGHSMDKTLIITFSLSVISFLLVYFVSNPLLNIILMVLAILGSNAATTMLWTHYCPSLYETGMVSSATGFLDCMSYAGAAIANLVFANAVTKIGWGNLILIWFGLMVIGLAVSLPGIRYIKRREQ